MIYNFDNFFWGFLRRKIIKLLSSEKQFQFVWINVHFIPVGPNFITCYQSDMGWLNKFLKFQCCFSFLSNRNYQAGRSQSMNQFVKSIVLHDARCSVETFGKMHHTLWTLRHLWIFHWCFVILIIKITYFCSILDPGLFKEMFGWNLSI